MKIFDGSNKNESCIVKTNIDFYSMPMDQYEKAYKRGDLDFLDPDMERIKKHKERNKQWARKNPDKIREARRRAYQKWKAKKKKKGALLLKEFPRRENANQTKDQHYFSGRQS